LLITVLVAPLLGVVVDVADAADVGAGEVDVTGEEFTSGTVLIGIGAITALPTTTAAIPPKRINMDFGIYMFL
jgi:hypothetical protein